MGGCLLRSQELLDSCTICRQWEWPPSPRCWEGILWPSSSLMEVALQTHVRSVSLAPVYKPQVFWGPSFC